MLEIITVPSLNSLKVPFMLHLQICSGVPWLSGRKERENPAKKLDPWDSDINL